MNKGITSIVAGLAMMGAVENTNAQDLASVEITSKKTEITNTLQKNRNDEKTLKLEINSSEPLPQALKHLTTIGKTKDQREKIADPAELQKIYETQLAAYNATKQELRALKKQGKDIKELVKTMKKYNPAMIPQHIQSIKKDNLLDQKDDEIRVENEKQAKEDEKHTKKDEIIKIMDEINTRYKKAADGINIEEKQEFEAIQERYGKDKVQSVINQYPDLAKNDINRIIAKIQ